MNKNKIKIAFIINVISFIFMLFSLIAMHFNIQFMAKDDTLSASNFNEFQFFTVDSNVLAGLICAIVAVYELLFLIKNKSIPRFIYVLKLIGTVGVALTLLVVIFFLFPTTKNPILLFCNANLFMHALTPILCIISFIFFEKGEKLGLKEAFIGIISMVLYSIYYIINVLSHIGPNGEVYSNYDFYGFLFGKAINAIISIPIIYLFTFAISYSLVFFNKFQRKK